MRGSSLARGALRVASELPARSDIRPGEGDPRPGGRRSVVGRGLTVRRDEGVGAGAIRDLRRAPQRRSTKPTPIQGPEGAPGAYPNTRRYRGLAALSAGARDHCPRRWTPHPEGRIPRADRPAKVGQRRQRALLAASRPVPRRHRRSAQRPAPRTLRYFGP